MTPRQSIERECGRRGREEVIAGCRALVRHDPVDPELVLALGGPGAARLLDDGPHADCYWLRVWGVRGLLWAWDDSAEPELALAVQDDSWRVREMAFRVVARHLLGDFLPAAARGREDHVLRVRQAASRAVVLLTASGT